MGCLYNAGQKVIVLRHCVLLHSSLLSIFDLVSCLPCLVVYYNCVHFSVGIKSFFSFFFLNKLQYPSEFCLCADFVINMMLSLFHLYQLMVGVQTPHFKPSRPHAAKSDLEHGNIFSHRTSFWFRRPGLML